jgi:hypothetical protein
MATIEIINTRIKSSVSPEEFIEGNRRFEKEFMRLQPGLISRWLGSNPDGSWVVINQWESAAAAQASSAAGGGNPAAGALMQMLDMGHMSMQHFDLVTL